MAHILIIHHEVQMREEALLASALIGKGYITSRISALEAETSRLECFQKTQFDLVIVHCLCIGEEVIHMIGTLVSHRQRVLILSEPFTAMSESEALRHGAVEVVSTRCPLSDIIQRIQRVVAGAYLLQAVYGRDKEARAAFEREWIATVQQWAAQRLTLPLQEVEDVCSLFAQRAFAAFWLALTPEKLERILSMHSPEMYLKLCVNTVMSEDDRVLRRYFLPPVTEEGPSLERGELWSRLHPLLSGEQEQVFATLHYIQLLPPLEICKARPDLFPHVEQVIELTKRIRQRLIRHIDDLL